MVCPAGFFAFAALLLLAAALVSFFLFFLLSHVHGAPALRARCGVRQHPFAEVSMNPATKALHETLIRLAKGAITAWEQWLHKQQPPQQS